MPPSSIWDNLTVMFQFLNKSSISFIFSTIEPLNAYFLWCTTQKNVNFINTSILHTDFSNQWHIYVPNSGIVPLCWSAKKLHYCASNQKSKSCYLFLFLIFFQLSHPWCFLAVSIGRLLEMYICDDIISLNLILFFLHWTQNYPSFQQTHQPHPDKLSNWQLRWSLVLTESNNF